MDKMSIINGFVTKHIFLSLINARADIKITIITRLAKMFWKLDSNKLNLKVAFHKIYLWIMALIKSQ